MSTLSRPGSSSPSLTFLGLSLLVQGTGQWEQGGSPTCASCGVAQPAHPPPHVLAPGTQLCGNLASALTPARTPCPCTRPPLSPGTGHPTEASCLGSLPVTTALPPEALGPFAGTPHLPREASPMPSSAVLPTRLGHWTAASASAWGRGALGSLQLGCPLSIRTWWTEQPWALPPQG